LPDLAGGQWPDLGRQAALEEAGAEKKQTRVERLLAAIWRAFDGQPKTLPRMLLTVATACAARR
jgi:hypothetical protein